VGIARSAAHAPNEHVLLDLLLPAAVVLTPSMDLDAGDAAVAPVVVQHLQFTLASRRGEGVSLTPELSCRALVLGPLRSLRDPVR